MSDEYDPDSPVFDEPPIPPEIEFADDDNDDNLTPPTSSHASDTVEADVTRILEGLNPAQKRAVTTTAKVVQILAPPGSGKTKTLTSRVAYMLAHGMEPCNIIVATFTVKAAREMRERIGGMIEGEMEKKLVLGTFHSIARRYLVKYYNLCGLQKGFGIADTNDTTAIINRLIKRREFSIDGAPTRSMISNMKAKMIRPADNMESAPREGPGYEVAVIYSEYEAELKTSNLLDYDDLLLRCVDLLRNNPRVVSNVEAVLIDEFQDSNIVQYDLMCLLAQGCHNITIVGDPDQSIYGFRAAEIANLHKMKEKYEETEQIFLEENYRSSACILNAAIEIIEQDVNRPKKPLLPTRGVGCVPVLKKLPTVYAEAYWMAKEITRVCAMTGGMINLNDVAILVRSAHLTRVIETVFVEQRVSYRLVAGTRFFDRLEVRKVLDYLRVLYLPTNNDALARIINVPPRRIGEVTIKSLLEEAAEKGKSLWDLIRASCQNGSNLKTKLNQPAKTGLSQFVGVILSSKWVLDMDTKSAERAAEDPDSDDGKGRTTLITLVNKVLKKLGYEEYLKHMYPKDFDSRWANVQELLVQADEFSQAWIDGVSGSQEAELPTIHGIGVNESDDLRAALGKFLANVALSSSADNPDGETGEATAAAEMVTISTIHNAKGLEWPVVFIPGCYEGSLPHSRAEDNDEERRLLYVAMTRAKGMLYMSYPTKNSKGEQISMSSFLKDPRINRLVGKAGPKIPPSIVKDLADILRRNCPELSTIQTVISSTQLESEEDELWTKDDFKLAQGSQGDYDECEDDDNSWSSTKRQRTNTMGSFRTFRPPVMQPPSTNVSAGFVSAGVRMRELSDEEKNRPRNESNKQSFESSFPEDPENKVSSSSKPGRKKKDNGCQDIQKFFAPKNPPKKTTPAASASAPALVGKKMNSVTTVGPNDGRPEYVLLSSSPERSSVPTSFTSASKITTSSTTMSNMQSFRKQSTKAVRSTASTKYMSGTTMMSVNNITMASLGANTTMGQLGTATAATSNNFTGGISGPMTMMPQKRTLGIRRQMDGWNNRARK